MDVGEAATGVGAALSVNGVTYQMPLTDKKI